MSLWNGGKQRSFGRQFDSLYPSYVSKRNKAILPKSYLCSEVTLREGFGIKNGAEKWGKRKEKAVCTAEDSSPTLEGAWNEM